VQVASLTIQGAPAGSAFPRSLGLMLAASYMGLFIIRPWEVLFPWLATIRFERIYGIAVVLGVALICGFRFRFNLQNAAVVVFLMATALSAAMAYDRASAWDKLYIVLTLVVCYWVLVSVVRSPYDLIFIVGVYVGFMEIYLGKALWEYFVHGGHSYTMGVTRLIGIEATFGRPNALAGSIVLSLPFWLLLWRRRREISAAWPARWKRLLNITLLLYAGLAALSILLTNSRTGIINLCVFLFLAGWRQGSTLRTVRNLVAAALVILLAWPLLPEEQRNRVRTIWDPESNASARESADGRIEGFKAGLVMFQRFPVLGVGPGSFIAYRASNVDGVNLVAHNMLGEMLGETGIVGTVGFILLVAAPLANRRRLQGVASVCPDVTVQVLADVSRACRDAIILLLVDGLSGDVLYRYNWLWLGAFCSLALEFASDIYQRHLANDERSDENSAAPTAAMFGNRV
jgi:O-antigen ligase